MVFLTGKRTEYSVRLDGETVEGGVALALELGFEENDPEKPFLEGRRLFKGQRGQFQVAPHLTRVSGRQTARSQGGRGREKGRLGKGQAQAPQLRSPAWTC